MIIIGSDHLAMGYVANEADALKKNAEKRRVAFFVLGTNSSETNDTPGTPMDIPATIVSFLGSPGERFGLGRDLTRGQTLRSLDPGFVESVPKFSGDLRQFWGMGNLRKEPVIRIDVMARQLVLGNSSVYPIPVLLSMNALGEVEEAFIASKDEGTSPDQNPPAFHEHAGVASIAVDRCNNFKSANSKLEGDGKNYCLFVTKDNTAATASAITSTGQLRLLQLINSIDLNPVLWETTTSVTGFVNATLNTVT
mmetsp:Transcript_5817/g.14539  ORF Transcript_5817/g.14539 Transcript_5817/m.14539 type:complete len:252 (-) Transcript_5817:737-1492(-)